MNGYTITAAVATGRQRERSDAVERRRRAGGQAPLGNDLDGRTVRTWILDVAKGALLAAVLATSIGGMAVVASATPAAAQSADCDNDRIQDESEKGLGTLVCGDDTDNDGLKDGEELYDLHTNPKHFDSDGDGFTDGQEVKIHGTNPTLADTDGDGRSDSQEYNEGTDAKVPDAVPAPPRTDSDSDGGYDDEEILIGTDPFNPDTDGDGYDDYEEVVNLGSDPLDPWSPNGGGSDAGGGPDSGGGSDSGRGDSDGDELYDDDETDYYGTNPHQWDTDGDGYGDGEEVYHESDPLDGWCDPYGCG
jgi:hypothetical protein